MTHDPTGPAADLLPSAEQVLEFLAVGPLEWADLGTLAAALDVDLDEAERRVRVLTNAGQLVETPSGFAVDELQRVRARGEMARDQGSDRALDIALRRLEDQLLANAAEAERIITSGHATRARDYRHPDLPSPAKCVVDEASALFWLDTQLSNLMAVIRRGYLHARYTYVWQLVQAMRPVWSRGCYPEQRYEAHAFALAAARQDGNVAAEARALTALGGAAAAQGRARQAEDCLRRAMVLHSMQGDDRGLSQALVAMAEIRLDGGAFAQAADLFRDARALAEGVGYERGVWLSVQGEGRASMAAGDLAEAQHLLDSSCDGLLKLGERYDSTWSRAWYALATARRGDIDGALGALAGALDMMTDLRSQVGQAAVLEITGQVYEPQQPDRAHDHYQRALHLLDGADPAFVARVQARDTALGNLVTMRQAAPEKASVPLSVVADTMERLAARLKVEREDAGLTQAQLASRLGVAANSLREWEAAREYPTLLHLIWWSHFFKLRLALKNSAGHECSAVVHDLQDSWADQEIRRLTATLRATRIEQSVTQLELCKRLVISEMTINRWEKGYGRPRPASLVAWARGVDLSLALASL